MIHTRSTTVLFAAVLSATVLAMMSGSQTLSAQASPSTADERVAQLYDIGDIVVTETIGGPDLRLGGADIEWKSEAGYGASSHAVARLLRAFVKPALQGNEEINPVGERWVVVLARPAQHAWVARFLEAARQDKRPVITVNCRCLRVPELTFLRDIKPALAKRKEPAETENAEPEVPDADEVSYVTEVLAPGDKTTKFIRELYRTEGAEDLTQQRLSVRPLEVAQMAVINQTAYVKDFDVEIAQGQFIADPIVDVVQDGIKTETAVSPLESGRLGVSLETVVSELARPIPTFTTQLGAGTAPVTIQLPSVSSTKIEAAVEIEGDQIVLMAPPPLNGKRFIFIVTVENDPRSPKSPATERERDQDRKRLNRPSPPAAEPQTLRTLKKTGKRRAIR